MVNGLNVFIIARYFDTDRKLRISEKFKDMFLRHFSLAHTVSADRRR